MTSWASPLAVSTDTAATACLLTVEGVLDSSTYLRLRDIIVKAALDEPTAVLVDVNALDVPADSAWAVFTSARYHVNRWPDVPVMLICASARRRHVARGSMTRAVPVHATVDIALTASKALLPCPTNGGLLFLIRLFVDDEFLKLCQHLHADNDLVRSIVRLAD